MVTIKNVTVAGATGNLGPLVLDALVKSGKFNLTVLKRIGSTSTLPPSVKVTEVDYDSVDDLTRALQGQDAVVSTLGFIDPTTQLHLIDAAAAAGVQRFLPSEFGSNTIDPRVRALPVFAGKVRVEAYLEDKAQTTGLTYTYVMNGGFFDWGLQFGFTLDVSAYKPKIYDGGNTLFSTTTMATVGAAVVGVLEHVAETRNRAVYVQDVAISQNGLLEMARRLTPGKTWEPVPVSLAEMKANADANVAKGILDMDTMYSYLYVSNFGEGWGSKFEKLDNELLGIKEKTEEELAEIMKKYLPKN